MAELIVTHLDVIVTIIGFIITYKMTTKSFSDEIRKSKISHNAEMIHSLPLELCDMMTRIQKTPKSKKKSPLPLQEYEKLMSKIFAYGSRAAVNIAVEVQQTSYKAAKTEEQQGYRLLILFSLLITQLKYDISDEIISPESWFELKITDYYTVRNDIVLETNKIISELSLNDKFYVEK